jgi:hypothetical protein
MSCDMRDLAHCALTKRQWYGVAAGLLYVQTARRILFSNSFALGTTAFASTPSTTVSSRSSMPTSAGASRETAMT